jgi:hypothetical protein
LFRRLTIVPGPISACTVAVKPFSEAFMSAVHSYYTHPNTLTLLQMHNISGVMKLEVRNTVSDHLAQQYYCTVLYIATTEHNRFSHFFPNNAQNIS